MSTLSEFTYLKPHPNESITSALKKIKRKSQDGRKNDALEYALRCVAEFPTSDEIYLETGYLLLQTGRIQESIRCFLICIKLNPHNALCKAYLSLPLLLTGDYDRGLLLYEWRLAAKQVLHCVPNITFKPQGSSFSKDETIILVAEQGFGDTIQFIRYGCHLAKDGANIIACVQAQLVQLLRESIPLIHFISPDDINTIKEGTWLPMMSLPLRLGINPPTATKTDSYIYANQERKNYWMKRLAARKKKYLAGIAWKGNPEAEKTVLSGRSMSIANLDQLITNAQSHTFVSLQKGNDGLKELQSYGKKYKFVDCQDEVNKTLDFRDTAAILSCCDVVITTDTCIAHLAGSMGIPVWIMLKRIPEWRWGLNDLHSFWYPSARLFRQHADDDWDSVVQALTQKLNESALLPCKQDASEPSLNT